MSVLTRHSFVGDEVYAKPHDKRPAGACSWGGMICESGTSETFYLSSRGETSPMYTPWAHVLTPRTLRLSWGFTYRPSPMVCAGDWQGNVAAVLDNYGNTIQTTTYYPYGEPTLEPSGQPYLFGGKERDHAAGRNTYDFGARCLAPYGRWTVVDKEAEKSYQTSPYSYSYCSGDPINKIDPDGNWDVHVSAFYDREAHPYAIYTVTNRHNNIIYRTVVKVEGTNRGRDVYKGDTPQGLYQILEWRDTGVANKDGKIRYPTDAFGPDYLLATHYISGEGGSRDGMHTHGGRSQGPELTNTWGCFRMANEDIRELRQITDAIEKADPYEYKGYITVADDLIVPVHFSDRDEIKYGWTRQGGQLPELIVVVKITRIKKRSEVFKYFFP